MEITHNDIFLDFETRSAAPLTGTKAVGSWRYSLDLTTKVLCLAYGFATDEPRIWIEGQQPPQDLMSAIESGKRIHGWNSMSFERAIFHNQCVPKLGWKEPHPEQYHDTMLDALTLALPAKLEDCCDALKLGTNKDPIGKKLIQKLCKPISAGKKKGQFRERAEFISDYADLYKYCKQDVNVERLVYSKLPYTLEGKLRQEALMIMRINERGLPIDTALVDAVLEGLEIESERITDRFSDITGIEKPTQRAKFREWLMSNGLELPDMQKETVQGIDLTVLQPNVQRAISLYKSSNNSSTAKFKKIKMMLNTDGTVKNNLIFNKANTGRLAGAGFQGQNLPAVTAVEPQAIIDAFLERNYTFLRLWSGVQVAAKQMIRPTIKAPPFMKLVSGDLKGIEARGACWITGEFNMLDNFRAGFDAYVASAAEMYSTLIDFVTKEERASGKIAVLAGGFGGGYKALMNMARKMGMNMTTTEARKIIKDFRNGRPKLVQMWANFDKAARTAIEEGSKVFVKDTRRSIFFYREGTFLYMSLPSGRLLSFPFPEVREEMFWGRLQDNVTAMWVDSSPGGNHKWRRRTLTGANLFQSAVQALCRDILFDGHMVAEEEDYPLVLSVHDEGLSLVPDEPSFNPRQYGEMMTRPYAPCLELPLGSDCWEGMRYRK